MTEALEFLRISERPFYGRSTVWTLPGVQEREDSELDSPSRIGRFGCITETFVR